MAGFKYARTDFLSLPGATEKNAAAGTYVKGQLLTVDATGHVAPLTAAATTTPPYVSLFDGTVAAGAQDGVRGVSGGALIPVARVNLETEYFVKLNAAVASPAVGKALSVTADGLGLSATPGSFEVTAFTGTGAVGDTITGRFTAVPKDI
ncbi:MAG: hypothetical protein LBN00_09950 [Oscillospiraceae bacterium]|jgi:hypothetical protein|nr:hypothetical protein [Oscillospiraceae bacterium]